MCGICGVAGGEPQAERQNVARMNDALRHRGPDGCGVHDVGGAVLGNRRLAIIDIEGGAQPIAIHEGAMSITFNGEIYNYRALRRDLEEAGHRFRTHSDTEVVLRLIDSCGAAGLQRLRGMFAFAVWDNRTGRLFAARDPFGQKPFHYSISSNRFIFASEIKSILAHPAVAAEPDFEAIDDYLSQRFVPAPRTMLKAIRKLAPGHWLSWNGEGLHIERFWAPDFAVEESRPDADWIDELEGRVDQAVRRHLVSDVCVGALLSGGMDSSAVVASAAGLVDEPLETFCVGSHVPGFDERAHARTVAEHFGTVHHESMATDALISTIPELVRCLDEPSDPISACTFEAARLASRSVKVVLGGDGGDEIFAGFDRYAAFKWTERYSSLPAWFRRGVIGPVARSIPGARAYKSVAQKARWLDDIGGSTSGALYARMTTVFRFAPEARSRLYGPALRDAVGSRSVEANLAAIFDDAPARDSLHRMLYTDTVGRFPEHSLLLSDRLSMAHGLELRSPLLDLDLAEFVASMPSRLKVRGRTTKYALREAFRKRLPPDILARSKQGFMLPIAYWMSGSNLRAAADLLRGGPLVSERWVEANEITRLEQEHESRTADHHVRLWMLLNLDAWCRIYLGLGEEWPEAVGRSVTQAAQ